MPNDSVATMERVFAALADRTRLRLLNLMAENELCVCYFVEVLRLPQPTISRHLARLRRAGLVEARREGKWMHYRFASPDGPAVSRVLADTLRWLGEDARMRAERASLARACCAPRKPTRLAGAPPPAPVFVQVTGRSTG